MTPAAASTADVARDLRLGDFLATYWGREPGQIDAAIDRPICSADDMLEMIRKTSDLIRAGREIGARFYVDGLQVTPQHPLEQSFVLADDETTLAGYIDTTSRRLGRREFCIVIDDAALLNRGVWQRMRQLAERIVRYRGYPTGRIEYNAFLGTCEFTPFGIHRDKSHTFTVLAGSDSKTMLTWPPQELTPVHGDRISKDPARIVALSNQGTCWRSTSATDLLYMPPGWWHVSRKDASSPFQASLGLGFALEQTPAEDLADLAARELRDVLHDACCEARLDPERADHAAAAASSDTRVELSAQNKTALAIARTALGPTGGVMDSVEATLRLRTLHRLAGLVESTRTKNLEPVFPPPRADSWIDTACRVRLTARLLRSDIGGRPVFSVNGASFTPEVPTGPFTELLRMMEIGDIVGVRDLVACGGDDVRRFLEFAWSFHALDIVD